MGKHHFARKQPVGFKRLKPHKESGTRKNRRTKDEIEHRLSPSASISGDSSEEHSNVASEEEAAEEEEIAYKEPSMYDHLLKTLSGSESFTKAYKKRQREEQGKSDSEEDLESGLESFTASEEEDDSNAGTDKESPRSLDMNSNPRGSDLVGEHSESIGDEDEGSSESDEARDLEVNGQSALEASVSMSSFNDHYGYKITETEFDNLSKRKWKYKWEMPAFDMLNCKWMGTGESLSKILQDVDVSSGYGLKLRLYKHWLDIYKASRGNDFHLSKQRNFFSLCKCG